jgi:outer membrane protein OmpA-like peptidoglycan-associated protein
MPLLLPFRSALHPILAAACLGVGLLALAGCDRSPEQAPAEAAQPRFPAQLTLTNNSGRIDYAGVVDNDARQAELLTVLRKAYGQGGIAGALRSDGEAAAPPWAEGLPALLPAFGSAQGATLRFEGEVIELTGIADADTRRRLREAALQAFPKARLTGLFAVIDPPPAVAAAPVDPVRMAETLNTLPVRFEDGSGKVDTDSLALVAQAAEAIRRAPDGTRLRIVGPVVFSGDAERDLFLSKQRAEALKVQLILNGINPGQIDTAGWGHAPDGTPIPGATPPPQGAPIRFELVR